MRFNDLVRATGRPDGAATIERGSIDTDTRSGDLPEDDFRNAGFVRGLFDGKQQRLARASRRGFLKGSAVAAGASIAAAAARLPRSPARMAEAQGSVTGSYGYRIWTGQCPSYATGQNCEPGCGPSTVCASCCDANGFFRNDEAAGYRLRPGACTYSGGAADGWLWSYAGQCGSCSSITYRCHDGLVLNAATGLWTNAICRSIVQCGGGVAPAPTAPPAPIPTPTPLPSQVSCPPGYTVVNTGQGYICQPDAPTQIPTSTPVPTADFFISGAVESAVDNGGNVTIRGWIKGPGPEPIEYRVRLDGASAFAGTASGFRPDVRQGLAENAGEFHGFEATINGVAAGRRQFCVFGVQGNVEKQLSCIVVDVAARPAATPLPTTRPVPAATPRPTSTPVAVPTPTASVMPPPTSGLSVVLPPTAALSANRPIGSVEIIRANTSGGGAFVSGWAGDADTSLPAIVAVTVDGTDAATTAATLSRPDVAVAVPQLGRNTGYAVNVPFNTTGTHTVCVNLIDPVDGTRYLSGCRSVTGRITGSALRSIPSADASPDTDAPVGAVEGMYAEGGGRLRVRGWLHFPHDDDQSVGFEVVVNGVTVGAGVADQPNHAISEALGIGANHGFDATFIVDPGSAEVEVYASSGDARTDLIELRSIEIL